MQSGMRVIQAEHLGMCFGVRDAIALARARARQGPLTILGELVHNPAVLQNLREQGIRIEADPARVQTRSAMITAHGASQRALAQARAHGLEVFEGTCPLVRHAHDAVARLVAAGFHPVIIGRRGHAEVRGLTEDLAEFDIVETEADVQQIAFREKFGVASQTTQPIERVRKLVDGLRRQFPESEVRFADTVCQPTKLRQRAAEELAAKSEVVIVIGGRNSNNTRELAATCAKFCARVHQVEGPDDLDPSWFKNAETAGVTAGTSTPDHAIQAVLNAIHRLSHFPAAATV